MRVVRMRSLAKSRNIPKACMQHRKTCLPSARDGYVKQVFMQWNLNEISHCCFGY